MFIKYLKAVTQNLAGQKRDARYIFLLIWASVIFGLSLLQARHAGWFDSVEKPIFHAINSLPGFFGSVMYVITQFGSLGGIIFWAPLGWYLVNRRAAVSVALSGLLGWILAKAGKVYVHRGRPHDLLHSVNLFHNHQYSGFGFPSGHATFAAACASVLYYQVKPRYRKYLLLTVGLVGLSRIYLGAHFPLDVVGGWALGAVSGSIISLALGNSTRSIRVAQIKRALMRRNLPMKSIKYASVDARGSKPVLMIDRQNNRYFGKLFGQEEHAADWLFKIYRFFRFKNMPSEEPYISAKRNLELESFANLWAIKNGVRTPGVVDMLRVGRSWLLIQEQIDGEPLTKIKNPSPVTLKDAWRQVKKMHAANMAHRDLRAANLMIDKKGQAWVIDFGFAEVSAKQHRQHMDIAELLMSMSLVAGVDMTVTAAFAVISKQEIKRSLPYLKKTLFSGATRQELRKNKQLFDELMKNLQEKLKVDEVKSADVERINTRKLFNVALLGIFLYVVIPQFKQFKGALHLLSSINLWWAFAGVILSILTYVAAGLVIYALAPVPLKIRPLILAQLASSFVSKMLPGGLGPASINSRYLTKAGLDSGEVSAVVITQNVIGVAAFMLPLLIFLVISGNSVSSLIHVHLPIKWIVIVLMALAICGLVIYFSQKFKNMALDYFRKFKEGFLSIYSSPLEISMAVGASFMITVLYIACLAAALEAFHVHLSIASIILVYATATIAKSAIPTPGGLGPIEVAMAAALISLGVVSTSAYAVVVLYRLSTFWLPIPFSLIAYKYLQNRHSL